MRIGESPVGPFTINDRFLHEPDLDFQLLLNAAAATELVNSVGVAISACALVLPDRDIAYIKHGAAPMTTLTIGRSPVDDSTTQAARRPPDPDGDPRSNAQHVRTTRPTRRLDPATSPSPDRPGPHP